LVTQGEDLIELRNQIEQMSARWVKSRVKLWYESMRIGSECRQGTRAKGVGSG